MLGTVPEISRDPVQFVPRLVGPRKVSWFIQVTSVIYSQWISWSTHKRLNIWLVVWNMAFIFHHIWDVILPIDELIFFKMVKTTNQMCIYINYIISYIYIYYIVKSIIYDGYDLYTYDIWDIYVYMMMMITSYTLPLTFWPNPGDLRTSMSLVIRTMAGAAFTTVLVLYKHAPRRRVRHQPRI